MLTIIIYINYYVTEFSSVSILYKHLNCYYDCYDTVVYLPGCNDKLLISFGKLTRSIIYYDCLNCLQVTLGIDVAIVKC